MEKTTLNLSNHYGLPSDPATGDFILRRSRYIDNPASPNILNAIQRIVDTYPEGHPHYETLNRGCPRKDWLMTRTWFQGILDRAARQKTVPQPVAETKAQEEKPAAIIVCTPPLSRLTPATAKVMAHCTLKLSTATQGNANLV